MVARSRGKAEKQIPLFSMLRPLNFKILGLISITFGKAALVPCSILTCHRPVHFFEVSGMTEFVELKSLVLAFLSSR